MTTFWSVVKGLAVTLSIRIAGVSSAPHTTTEGQSFIHVMQLLCKAPTIDLDTEKWLETTLESNLTTIYSVELPTYEEREYSQANFGNYSTPLIKWLLGKTQNTELRREVNNRYAQSLLQGNSGLLQQLEAEFVFVGGDSARLVNSFDDLAVQTERIKEYIANSFTQDDSFREKVYAVYNSVGLEPEQNIDFLLCNSGLTNAVYEEIIQLRSSPSVAVDEFSAATCFTNALTSQLESIIALEQKHPGSVRSLHEEFGLEGFFRYSQAQLIHQYEHKDDTLLSYGIAVYPKDDWNGAFGDMGRKNDPLCTLCTTLQEHGWGLRIFEAESPRDLYRNLRSASQRYALHGAKASFLLLAGHGTPDRIQFGKGKKQELTKDILRVGLSGFDQTRTHWLQGLLIEKPTVILASCSTGDYGGIAEDILQVPNAVIYAPTKPTNISSIESHFSDSDTKLSLDVRYLDTGGIDPTRQLRTD